MADIEKLRRINEGLKELNKKRQAQRLAQEELKEEERLEEEAYGLRRRIVVHGI